MMCGYCNNKRRNGVTVKTCMCDCAQIYQEKMLTGSVKDSLKGTVLRLGEEKLVVEELIAEFLGLLIAIGASTQLFHQTDKMTAKIMRDQY